MSDSARHDIWASGNLYESYIGCWSYHVACSFLQILRPEPQLEWVDVGSGTGALSRAILQCCEPAGLIGVEPSVPMLNWAKQQFTDERAGFIEGDARDLPLRDDSADIAVAGLVLNFISQPVRVLEEMKRIVRPGGRVAFYVWDYAGGGLEIVRAFWDVAVSIEPEARRYCDAVRFDWCNEASLSQLMIRAGLREVQSQRIVIPTPFKNFEDYWQRFSRGAGPASSFYQQLSDARQGEIRAALERHFKYEADGSIRLTAAAWALHGRA